MFVNCAGKNLLLSYYSRFSALSESGSGIVSDLYLKIKGIFKTFSK